MIVEIGTSDFRTMAGKEDGLFVEPIKYYYDRLPECRKENVAISDFEGLVKMFYVTDEEIQQFSLPSWVRGCSSLYEPHPSVMKLFTERKLDFLRIRHDEVPVTTIGALLAKHSISKVDVLKVDTEGHDCVIVNNLIDDTEVRPTVIQFEANSLTDHVVVNKLKARLESIGYRCKRIKFDMVCELR